MAYEREREKYTENAFTLVSFSDTPRQKAIEIVRSIPMGLDEYEATGKAFLSKFISAANLAESSTITDPWANQKKAGEGVYRIVSVSYSQKGQAAVQVLRKGYATTVLTTDTPPKFNDEAFLVGGQLSDVNVSQRTIEWRNVGQPSIETCIQSIMTAAVFVDPVVAGNTLTGTWLVLASVPTLVEDGTAVIRAQIQKCSTSTTFDVSILDRVVSSQAAVGAAERAISRVFYYRTEAAKDSLISLTAPVGAAVSNYTFGGVPYTHSHYEITPHGGGIYTITQGLRVPRYTNILNRWAFEDGVEVLDAVWYESVRTDSGSATPTWATFKLTRTRKLCSSESEATDYAEDTGTPCYDEHGKVRKFASVKYAGRNDAGSHRWWAYTVAAAEVTS